MAELTINIVGHVVLEITGAENAPRKSQAIRIRLLSETGLVETQRIVGIDKVGLKMIIIIIHMIK